MTEDVKILQESNQELKERFLISENDSEHMDQKLLYKQLSKENIFNSYAFCQFH